MKPAKPKRPSTPGSSLPTKITLTAAARLIRRDHPGLWETLTPEERREAVHKLNVERGAVKPKVSEAEAFIRRTLARPRR